MTTAAAVDRLVHHAVTLERVGSSVRADEAEKARKEQPSTTTTTRRPDDSDDGWGDGTDVART